MCGKLIFLILYFGLSFLVTLFLYNMQKKFYKEILFKKKDSDETISLHKEFEVFSRKDKLSFGNLYLGVLFLFWIRFPIAFLEVIIFMFLIRFKVNHLKTPGVISKEERPGYEKLLHYYLTLFFYSSGIIVNYKKKECKEIYQKYLGKDYEIQYDKEYSSFICNHTSFIDSLLGIRYCQAGFISKEGVRNSPFIGPIAVAIQSLFVSRSKSDSRNETLKLIEERQKNFLEGKSFSPIIIFPEGTTTSNRHLLPFKKGAFYSLLPLKPMMIKNRDTPDYQISCGSSDVMINYIRGLTKLFVMIDFYELPIIKPTEYMYQNYSHFGKEKWEIYAEVTRSIYSEVGGFEKSQFGLRDSTRYSNSMDSGKFIEKEE